MATIPYNLRTRLNGQAAPHRTTPTASPLASKSATRSPRKQNPTAVSLQLQHVIGTTTTTPTGLTCCATANSYAYCAGSVAVLASVYEDGTTKKKYYRARPTAVSVNPSTSHYHQDSPSSTPSRRRTSIFSPLRSRDRDSGTTSSRDWEDGPSQTWTARERIKTVTCVALSENGKWLAVGESGYSPRVLLYSTAEQAAVDVPVSIVSDHAIGVKSVAFSSDGRYLATLGNLNDGFLFVWNINPRTGQLTLHAANKCTTNICDMKWCGPTLITAGTRHVKAWMMGETTRNSANKRSRLRASTGEVSSPGPATLVGRNALLGSLVDCTFTAAIAVDSRTTLLTTDAGHLCIFQPEGSPDVQVLKGYDFGLSSIGWQCSTGKVILGSRQGLLYEDYDGLLAAFHTSTLNTMGARSMKKRLRSSAIRMSLGLHYGESIGISAVTCLPSHTIALDTDGNLQMESVADESNHPTVAFASHSDLIQGVQRLPSASDLGSFYTWSRKGELKFWDTGGTMLLTIRIEPSQPALNADNDPNELRVARLHENGRKIVLGDRLGVLQLFDLITRETTWIGRAHGAEVNDVAIKEDKSLVASCGRDRMVQLFLLQSDHLQLLQTLDDHIGAVNKVLFSQDGERLLSCSTDRTVIVRERTQRHQNTADVVAYLSTRIVTLKSAPLSMTFAGDDRLLVSTNDRHVAHLDLTAGTVAENFKITDPENDDTVALNSIGYSSRGAGKDELMDLLLACSPTDKSIRVYDANKCTLLTRESGHTEGISDQCLIEDRTKESGDVARTLVSTGMDGTIMIWNVTPIPPTLTSPTCEVAQVQTAASGFSDVTQAKGSPATLPPLRKVLSKMDVLDFARNGAPSPRSPRSLSPPRLTKKRSQLALTSTIPENDEQQALKYINEDRETGRGRHRDEPPSSPASPITIAKAKTQRSRSTAAGEETAKRAMRNRSSSPSRVGLSSTPSTPRRAQANNGRLRRPPSIPTDLRDRALAQRRQSTSQANDFGSMGMAVEQATRMLRTFRKKLATSKEDLDLAELEGELEQVANLVKEKKSPPGTRSLNGTLRRSKTNEQAQPTQSELDDLAVLLDRTNLAERPPRMANEVECIKI